MNRRHIVVFARAPVAGRVKTRLCRYLGGRTAANLARRMLIRTMSVANQLTATRLHLLVFPSKAHTLFKTLVKHNGAMLQVQRGHDLGERMFNAFHDILETGDQVLLIGTDCPSINRRYLQSAFSRLESGDDAVLGPAADGGYVLLGLTRNNPFLFSDIGWGTELVLADSIARLDKLGWSYSCLPVKHDIDIPADLIFTRGLIRSHS